VINAAKMHGDDDLIEWQPASGVIPMGENGREGIQMCKYAFE